MHNKLLSMGSGIFLLIFSIMVVVLDSSNFLAIGLAFFVLMGGLMLVMIVPAAVYGGFMVKVATVNFSETTGSLTATTPEVSVSSVTVYNYIGMKAMGTTTSDGSISNSEVAKITISMTLFTPSGPNVTVSNINMQGGIGTRNHTETIGPGDGLQGTRNFLLKININVDITTPAGVLVQTLSLSLTKSFTVS